jgi:D-glycero-alpha-D-manno-heptose 1-phosphate guanylyltransferase
MLDRLTVILLAGGLGTRLRGIHPELPKPMIPVAGRPFLEWSIRYWCQQGLRRFIVSTGHRSEVVSRFLDGQPFPGASVAAVAESHPLGTGGAIRAAASTPACSDPFIVGNGDSLLLADIPKAIERLDEAGTDGLILGVETDDTSRFGSIEAGPGGQLARFREKCAGQGLINAGVYVLRRQLLDLFPFREPLSLETEVFPALLSAGAAIRVVPTSAPFLDIGTPESLAAADRFIRANIGSFGMPE